ncbi:MAG TPA: hypothetical protein VG962_07115 [Steroidobacteraceae bacterium]|nr:hypothetical protein [Steroidobacteraceae bacterium]
MKVTCRHLMNNVLPAALDYEAAEKNLSVAYAEDVSSFHWEGVAQLAKRRAAELSIAIDGLTDRAHVETGAGKNDIRNRIAALCYWPGGTIFRPGSAERIRGVANAYKHQTLNDPTLPITSDSDVLVVGLGFGLDVYGVGKYSDIEVIVKDKNGQSWKFLGDAPTVISAWFRFLVAHGMAIPNGPYQIFGLQLYP